MLIIPKSTLNIRYFSVKSIVLNNSITKLGSSPLKEYERLVKVGKLRNDDHQKEILKNLTSLHNSLKDYHPPRVEIPSIEESVASKKSSFFSKFLPFHKQKPLREAINYTDEEFTNVPKGLYLWGDVGCGKTMLMDLFYSIIPSHLSKKRIHFHQFMQNLHKKSHEIVLKHGKSDIDPIPILAAEISQNATVLCFDEFQVTDVADAMLLRRLLMNVLAPSHGLILFATSNRIPNDLYINGIQRESFIPVIRLLEKRTEVIYLDSPIDYRKIPKPISSVYYYPSLNHGDKNIDYFSTQIEKEKTHHIHEWFNYFTQSLPKKELVENAEIEIWGRKLIVPKSIPKEIAIFTFNELCGKPLAAGDYLALASHYKTFIVTDIPYLSINSRDRVRRFITFLDAAYDHQCKLITTGANSFSKIFVDPTTIEAKNEFNLKPESIDQIEDYNDKKGGSLIKNQNKNIHEKLSKELGTSKIDANLLKTSNDMFQMDEEKFAFVRALSRLTQMSTTDWVQNDRTK